MSLTIDAVSESAEFSFDTAVTWSHIASGSERAVVVCVVGRGHSVESMIPTGVTYAEAPMSLVVSRDNGLELGVSIWKLASPPTGAQTVLARFAIPIEVAGWAAAVSFTGASGVVTEASASQSGETDTPSVSVTSLSPDAIAIDTVYHKGNNDIGQLTPGAGQTGRASKSLLEGSLFDGAAVSTKPAPSPGSVTMSWSASSFEPFVICAAVVQPAAEGTSEPEPPPPPVAGSVTMRAAGTHGVTVEPAGGDAEIESTDETEVAVECAGATVTMED